MPTPRTIARLCAVPTALAATVLLAAGPASAHVTVTPSSATAGDSSVLTFALSHGCDGSPTTRLEIAVPEEVLSVSPTRSPFWKATPKIVELDEPVADAHGNEVTERVESVVFEATEPLPDGTRDAVELSLTVPDLAGETLSFPTIQTCQQGRTAWVEIPEDGQDPHALESPAPGFEVVAADDGGHGAEEDAGQDAEPVASAGSGDGADADDSRAEALGWAGLGAGVLALVVAGLALVRSRRTA
jgi:uncharacterized protein YcnI